MSTQHPSIPRAEHPRPDFMRDTFENLNGQWQFAYDDQNLGLDQKWFAPGHALEKEITVPFCYQSELSGICEETIHPILWYRRAFTVPASMQGQRVLLRFGAVDYACRVFVNGQEVGSHKGGYDPFALDITHCLKAGENDLCVRVVDEPDCVQPRGKQYWKDGLMGCWYTPSSGIWQTVYLEAIGDLSFDYIHITPDIDRHIASFEMALDKLPSQNLSVDLSISMGGETVTCVTRTVCAGVIRMPVDMLSRGDLDSLSLWSPKNPALYDVTATLRDEKGQMLDRVKTYFGMRKIENQNGVLYLNNQPLYQRLILDQGYWPKSLITPPSDEAIQEDIRLTLRFGYNGARKHQKVEDPRYYYWADKMGLLVWGEVPSPYEFSDAMVENVSATMLAFIRRDFNHPCIITWAPLNESWGVRQIYADKRQQATGQMLYYMCKAADGTRLVSTNDGWEQVTGDYCALHDYVAWGDGMARHFDDRARVEAFSCDVRPAWAEGQTPTGKEIFLVSEYGGIAFTNIGLQGEMGGMETWGYNGKVESEEAFFERFESVHNAVRAIPYCQGYCFTQLTDVMQEVNGLVTPDRKPKMDPERFAKINTKPDHMPSIA